MNRIEQAIENTRPAVAELSEEKRRELEDACELDVELHFAFQTAQSVAHADGRLTLEEAQLVYGALGRFPSDWTPGTDLTTKIVIFQLMKELMSR